MCHVCMMACSSSKKRETASEAKRRSQANGGMDLWERVSVAARRRVMEVMRFELWSFAKIV